MGKRSAGAVVLLLLLSFGAWSEDGHWPVPGYFLDLPVGWTTVDGSDPCGRAFSNSTRTAVLRVSAYPSEAFDGAREMYQEYLTELDGQGEGVPFLYRGRDAFFADIRFATSRFDARGYLLLLEEESRDFALLAFTPVASYADSHDQLISALDSFAPDRDARGLPGPVSHFHYPYPSARTSPLTLSADGAGVRLSVDLEELESLVFLIEREARILAGCGGDFGAAWGRYYRTVYRDNSARLAELAAGLRRAWGLDPDRPRPWVERLLRWIQGFEYVRSGTFSDLTPPALAAFAQAGDCDSRALLFVILLEHVGIDAVLLVSSRYAHSAAGVDLPGEDGARMRHLGKDYLFAEVTDQVGIGMVARDMADPSGWVVIDLP